MDKRGFATYRNGKLYFNDEGWKAIKEIAAYQHKSPKQVVIAAIKRYIRAKKG